MLRSLFSKLTGERADPTRAWPICRPGTPEVDLARRTVGALRFGDPIESADGFGRPTQFRWIQKEYCELLYADAGFQIDFDAGRLPYAAFFLGPDPGAPGFAGLRFVSIQIDGHQIGRETSLADLQTAFGPAESEDRDAEEMVVYFSRHGMTIEVEAISSAGLKRVSVFPRDDEPGQPSDQMRLTS